MNSPGRGEIVEKWSCFPTTGILETHLTALRAVLIGFLLGCKSLAMRNGQKDRVRV